MDRSRQDAHVHGSLCRHSHIVTTRKWITYKGPRSTRHKPGASHYPLFLQRTGTCQWRQCDYFSCTTVRNHTQGSDPARGSFTYTRTQRTTGLRGRPNLPFLLRVGPGESERPTTPSRWVRGTPVPRPSQKVCLIGTVGEHGVSGLSLRSSVRNSNLFPLSPTLSANRDGQMCGDDRRVASLTTTIIYCRPIESAGSISPRGRNKINH